jgi:hypothetical protein
MIILYKDDFENEAEIATLIQKAQDEYEYWKTSVGVPAPVINSTIRQLMDGAEWEFKNETRGEESQRLKQESYEVHNAEKLAAQTIPSERYAQYRSEDYVPITEQLDMIYWDKINGTSLHQDHCAEIKNRYKKP